MKEPKEIDGIFQADNPMPEWWKLVWLLTIIGSIAYAIYFHTASSWGQEEAFKIEVAEHEKKFGSQKKIGLTAEGANPFRDDEVAIADGQKNFGICAACHNADGKGLVGPSLMDEDWIHGSTDKEVYEIVMKGVSGEKLKLGKGAMPAHEKSLGSEKVLKIMAWLAKNNPSLKKGI